MIKELLTIYIAMALTTGRDNTVSQYFSDQFLRMGLLLGALFNIMTWLLLAYRTNFFPDVMPLHYNIYYGIDSYGPWFYIFMMPTIGVIVLLVNVLVSFVTLHREKLLSYILVGVASFTQLVILISTFAIIAVNV